MVWCVYLASWQYLFDILAVTDVCAGGTDGFLLASFPLATRENITIISNSISLSDPHTLELNGPLIHTHSDPRSGLNFRITPNPHASLT